MEQWDEALRLLSPVANEPVVRERISRFEQLRAEAAARQAALGAALARTRQLFDQEDFPAAERALAEAQEIDAANADVAQLESRLTAVLRTIEQLEDAMALFEADESTAAEERLQSARLTLGALPQRPPSLQVLLATAERARASQQQRALTRDALESLRAGKLDQGLELARSAVAIDSDNDAARGALAQLEAAIAERGEHESMRRSRPRMHTPTRRGSMRRSTFWLQWITRGQGPAVKTSRGHSSSGSTSRTVPPPIWRRLERAPPRALHHRGAFVADALAIDPITPAAVELQQSLAAIARGLAGLDEARDLFTSDDAAELQQGSTALEDASSSLAPFADRYAVLRERLAAAASARDTGYARREQLEQTLLDLVAEYEPSHRLSSAHVRKKCSRVCSENATNPSAAANTRA